ncbi:1-aminocyclopropane-1-carboxylate deaminase/D-cysteine desulfhydrase [Pseudoalteromonas luteoviolacea]|uniref:1-aminocyclopropane-1-carboxylate deaminase/D-cysteine desulfhydrase n=1 Tax=Pseudoalteromonas luteoviolacea TaxID=43657 RepID=UPI0007B07D18|nr:pyridoxal-phosphate dependent enzyme [Pseudoalteromonas luteoviolacea]MBQ4876889.1 1-aminocyclopropane-1-carboxylate deaminase/D-cysteine desulfhydrase [Pseudoalteromonas luteoviolacea]MBQ4905322.1 1-aminocyclopropane-1-carboxylate deaminase/D-cysteine desulfhydrase [Pseudoalteromonas luteoviolacea]
MKTTSYLESPLQTIRHPLLAAKKIELLVKRDDLLHPTVQGNKWRKLKYNLVELKRQQCRSLFTFGGAFSNHVYATAMASKLYNIPADIIVRGPHLDAANPTIRFAKACNVNLHPVTRIEYRQRHDPDYLALLKKRFPNAFIIPEGGSNQFALQGCEELARSLPKSDYVCCAVGSGGTLAGILDGLDPSVQLIGFAVLKGAEYLNEEIMNLNPKAMVQKNWQILTQFHEGGYGKFSHALWQFCQTMRRDHHLPLEPIYTGKMMYGLWQLIEQDHFPKHSQIIAIHTGGLQGLDGLRYRQLI